MISVKYAQMYSPSEYEYLSRNEILRLLNVSYDDLLLGISGEYISHVMTTNNCIDIEGLVKAETEKYISNLLLINKEVFGLQNELFTKYSPLVLPSGKFHAEATYFRNKPIILMYSGIFALLSFIAEIDIFMMCVASSPLLYEDDKNRLIKIISHCGNMLAYKYLMSPFLLPKLSWAMEEKSKMTCAIYLCSMEIFVLLHEIFHIELGHLNNNDGEVHPHCQLFMPDGPLDEFKQRELEADYHAFACLGDETRSIIAPGVIGFLHWLSLFQSFTSIYNNSHPLAIDRAKMLIKNFKLQDIPGMTCLTQQTVKISQHFLENRNFVKLARISIVSEQLIAALTEFRVLQNQAT